jgi:hypothetical protein
MLADEGRRDHGGRRDDTADDCRMAAVSISEPRVETGVAKVSTVVENIDKTAQQWRLSDIFLPCLDSAAVSL